ncbi:hypothetical protein JOS77_07810 [Chromobacterium haemolyticum]|nr:hypothetical protein JOS77_07810 [Chromobacterium haemolyticum]
MRKVLAMPAMEVEVSYGQPLKAWENGLETRFALAERAQQEVRARAAPEPAPGHGGRTGAGHGTTGLRTCLRSAARRETWLGECTFKMLMYRVYTPLFQPFSPCLALAREIVNSF